MPKPTVGCVEGADRAADGPTSMSIAVPGSPTGSSKAMRPNEALRCGHVSLSARRASGDSSSVGDIAYGAERSASSS